MRAEAIADVERHFDEGGFRADPGPAGRHQAPRPRCLGCGPSSTTTSTPRSGRRWASSATSGRSTRTPTPGAVPFLVARRHEDPDRPTVLTYGHGDVVRGLEGEWDDDRDPWTLDVDGRG